MKINRFDLLLFLDSYTSVLVRCVCDNSSAPPRKEAITISQVELRCWTILIAFLLSLILTVPLFRAKAQKPYLIPFFSKVVNGYFINPANLIPASSYNFTVFCLPTSPKSPTWLLTTLKR